MDPAHGMTVDSDGYRYNVNLYSGRRRSRDFQSSQNMETVRVHESCKSQSHLECSDIFTPTRRILQAISRTWKTDRVHDLPTVTVPSSRKHLRTMIHGGVHRTRQLSIYGTKWTTKIGRILWRNLRQRANRQYGKQGTRNVFYQFPVPLPTRGVLLPA
jgi:hypothetical protein